jgi:hypothetical protein
MKAFRDGYVFDPVFFLLSGASKIVLFTSILGQQKGGNEK